MFPKTPKKSYPQNLQATVLSEVLTTLHEGDRSPVESVLFDEEWKTTSQISIIPFIDQGYFGKEIHSFSEELKSIGLVIGFNYHNQFIVDSLKSPCLTSLTAEAVLFILEFVRHLGSSTKLT